MVFKEFFWLNFDPGARVSHIQEFRPSHDMEVREPRLRSLSDVTNRHHDYLHCALHKAYSANFDCHGNVKTFRTSEITLSKLALPQFYRNFLLMHYKSLLCTGHPVR